MKIWFEHNKKFVAFNGIFLSLLAIAAALYAMFGHRLLGVVYHYQGTGIFSRIMSGRTTTPLEHYLQAADRIIWGKGLPLVTAFLVISILVKTRYLAKTIWVSTSFFLATFLLFCFFELFPSIISPLNLDTIHYYHYKAHFLPDEQLVYKKKPLYQYKDTIFVGNRYSPAYKIDIPVLTYAGGSTDEDGFINPNSRPSSDVIVLGDSFIDFRLNDDDSFVRRLEKISGLAVTDLGVGGYGPFHYIEVLKRYGLKRSPKAAIFSLYDGNDLEDILEYVSWRKGGDYYHNMLTESFFQRYLYATWSTGRFISRSLTELLPLHTNRATRHDDTIHPDIAEVQVANQRYRMELFSYANPPKSIDELLNTIEWQKLRALLQEFKDICVRHGITPILMDIPTKTRIYARYSTERSGKNWLRMRDEQIVAKTNIEKAIALLAAELEIELISLTPAFDAAVGSGSLLYYPLDTHWTSEARELAAQLVAERLKLTFGTAS